MPRRLTRRREEARAPLLLRFQAFALKPDPACACRRRCPAFIKARVAPFRRTGLDRRLRRLLALLRTLRLGLLRLLLVANAPRRTGAFAAVAIIGEALVVG